MTITIPDNMLTGLNAIVARANAEAQAAATEELPAIPLTPEGYLTDRVYDILSSYTAQEVERIKKENEDFFTQAALLPVDAQAQLKAMVAELSAQA